ncbi:MAG: hypothetical protein Q8O67_33875 [Deltaproteobacteria bacterium]|nr:hypothetical protein [Deltaproteobacteria bacterium]
MRLVHILYAIAGAVAAIGVLALADAHVNDTLQTRMILNPEFRCLHDVPRGGVSATVKTSGCFGGSESALAIEWDEESGSIAHTGGREAATKKVVTQDQARALALLLASAASLAAFNDGSSTTEQHSELMVSCGVGEEFHARFDGSGIPNAHVYDVLDAARRHGPERLSGLSIVDVDNIGVTLIERLAVSVGVDGLIVDESPLLRGLGLLSPLSYSPVSGLSEIVWRSGEDGDG